ncbi:dTDP-4-dehydrorhamnose reductase [Aquirhabdus parva]|uniref:dTDP-4-dehydrorhamnose reductase n=1 Tax=Aquirhabdus parva TaxID=2283318 RepID=A0A345PBV0_9GAMM|nr:dTDP-4-dehydrorhamnose reductase [Aquirhabdus parva]
MLKILLLGKNGQVGWELQRALSPLGELRAYDRSVANLDDPESLRELIREYAPHVIVNAAAYTAVDKAESDVDSAKRINALSVAVLAEESKRLDGLLIHYSTDYVFDGHKESPYVETDTTAPLSVYGQTKRDGEIAIATSGCKHLIFRTSWVFASRGGNFAKTMLRLAAERESLNVVADQFGAPTSAELIADVTALAIYRLHHDAALAEKASGIYHLVASGETSWHGYAQFVIAEAIKLGRSLKTTPTEVHPIPASAYPVPAARPHNSRLQTQKLQNLLGIKLPNWQYHVQRLIHELVQS